MKSALLALPLLIATFFPAVPASAATTVQASGSVISTIDNLTPISTQGDVFTFDLRLSAAFTGTFSGTSLAVNRCVEQLSTGEAHCTGPEAFTGSVADRTGTVMFFDTYFFNLKTGAFSGHSSITGGSANVRGVVDFSGVGTTATYSGSLEFVR
jgi:hypothetical protein